MKLSFTITLLIIITQVSVAQLKVLKLSKADIPKSITYKGHIINAVKYTDKTGDHIVFTTETGETPAKKSATDDGRDAALYAYHYDITGSDQLELSWQTYDFISDCNVDIKANYVPGTFAVTDVDNNGIAEVWLVYRTACRGDVSPSEMKIIMHEADKKYAVRGTSKVKLSEKEYIGGTYTFDAAFKAAPATFRKYAADTWKKNIMDTF
ncbi:M949_RS01915 family surface polysaccharide biosynthesis protein [Mucilaginibacter sp. Mucisp86]|uniref:M949_RS01915 family surface polysaccharide biosynthesis protein n=1 Tax=Mucilaginibacter sp. Mucisp86 TaxID=3243060 RepID=UPI0039B3A338